jgi:hypothetical protein
MKYCIKCGYKLRVGQAKCPDCGKNYSIKTTNVTSTVSAINLDETYKESENISLNQNNENSISNSTIDNRGNLTEIQPLEDQEQMSEIGKFIHQNKTPLNISLISLLFFIVGFGSYDYMQDKKAAEATVAALEEKLAFEEASKDAIKVYDLDHIERDGIEGVSNFDF